MAIQRNSIVIVKGARLRVIAVKFLGGTTSEFTLRDEDGVKWTTIGKNVTAKSKMTRTTY